jgi:hypothetical protein
MQSQAGSDPSEIFVPPWGLTPMRSHIFTDLNSVHQWLITSNKEGVDE